MSKNLQVSLLASLLLLCPFYPANLPKFDLKIEYYNDKYF